jgi:hypothetical protein
MTMQRKTLYSLLFLVLPTLVAVVVALVLINWRIPTPLEVDLTVDRVVFTVGGTDLTPILNSVSVQSITAEKFAYVRFSPEKLEVADPAQYIDTEDRYPESGWVSLAVTPPVVITGEDEVLQPAVTLDSAITGANTTGSLGQVLVRPGAEVTLEVRGAQTVDLTSKWIGRSLPQPYPSGGRFD